MKGDRMDMLRQLTMLSDGAIDTDVFKTYIPKYYAQIYSLYSLLNVCFISYNDIAFEEPIVIDNSITICFSIPKNDFKILSSQLETMNGNIKYLREHRFKAELTGSASTARLTITRSL